MFLCQRNFGYFYGSFASFVYIKMFLVYQKYHVSCEPLRIFWKDDTTCSTGVPCVLPTTGWIPGFSACSGKQAWHSCRAGCIVIPENPPGLATHMCTYIDEGQTYNKICRMLTILSISDIMFLTGENGNINSIRLLKSGAPGISRERMLILKWFQSWESETEELALRFLMVFKRIFIFFWGYCFSDQSTWVPFKFVDLATLSKFDL